MKSIKGETIRFILAGGLNTAFTYLIYLILLNAMDYQLAFTLTFAIGIVFAYIINSLFVFKVGLTLRRLLQYPIIYALQYGFGLIFITVLVGHIGLDQKVAPIINVILLMPITFGLNKLFLTNKIG